jgi:hypothetical protein
LHLGAFTVVLILSKKGVDEVDAMDRKRNSYFWMRWTDLIESEGLVLIESLLPSSQCAFKCLNCNCLLIFVCLGVFFSLVKK